MIFFLTFYILHLKQIEREPLGSTSSRPQNQGKPPSNNVQPGPPNTPNKPNNSPGSPPPPPPNKPPTMTVPPPLTPKTVTPAAPVSTAPSFARSVYNKIIQRIENEASLVVFTQGKKFLNSIWDYFMPPTPTVTTNTPSQTPETKNQESKTIGANLSGNNCKIETYFFVAPGCENKGKLCIIKQSCGESSLEAICPSTECTSLNPEERMQKCTGSTAVSFISESKGPTQQKTQKK